MLNNNTVATNQEVSNHVQNVSNPHSVTAAQINAAAYSHTHSYLPLTGGTITGQLTVGNDIITSRGRGIKVLDEAGTTELNLIKLTSADTGSVLIGAGCEGYDAPTYRATTIYSNGTLRHNKNGTSYNILDTDNYDNYALPLSGGTLTGTLQIDNNLHFNSLGDSAYRHIRFYRLYESTQCALYAYISGVSGCIDFRSATYNSETNTAGDFTTHSRIVLDTGGVTISNSELRLNNNHYLTVADTSGNHTTIAGMNSSNVVWLGGYNDNLKSVVIGTNGSLVHNSNGTHHTILDSNNVTKSGTLSTMILSTSVTVPKIVANSSQITFVTGSGEQTRLYYSSSNNSTHFSPVKANGDGGSGTCYLGSTSYRWNTAYFANTITASDEKEKDILPEFIDAEVFIMGLEPICYRRTGNGDGGKRIHMGFGAQTLSNIIIKMNLGDLSVVQAAVLNEDGTENPYIQTEEVDDSKLSWGINYTEIIAPLVKVVQMQAQKMAELEAKIAK